MKALIFATVSALMIAAPALARPPDAETVADLFAPDYRNQIVLDIEAAIAGAQAQAGVIPKAAAREIAEKADVALTPLDALDAEYDIVRHRMVALLNVWKRSLSEEAADYVHFGVTTVDIYDTAALLQIRGSIRFLIRDMRAVEEKLLTLAETHRATPMIGRTLGQHALPITFGKKVAVWAAMNRRNIDRLEEVLDRLERLGVLKGAVGTHLGLGEKGIEIERDVSRRLGLQAPDPADWHGVRDVFAEYAQVLALTAKSCAAIGGEIFRLQMTDIAEVIEGQPAGVVGSSAMPHKQNPSRSEALIHHGRTIPRLAEVLLDDVENAFERDNTSRPNDVIEEISVAAARMVADADGLLRRLEVDPARMRRNIDETGGLVMAQRIVLFLADDIGRDEAEERVRRAAFAEGDFRSALLADEVLGPLLAGEIDRLLQPEGYLGLAAEQVDQTVAAIRAARRKDAAFD